MYVYGKISLSSSENEKCFKVVKKSKPLFSYSAILSENRNIYEINGKI